MRTNYKPLPKPVRISEQKWPEGTIPLVTIRCNTYNHVNFIRDAVEGFLMQETTFPVEIMLHDDASTDGTSEIVREYAERYPNLIRAKIQEENQYSQGRKEVIRAFHATARGEYIAFCEGDDYWLCTNKLEIQCKLLQTNQCAVMCCHDILKIDEFGRVLNTGRLPQISSTAVIDQEDVEIVKGGEVIMGRWIPTLSLFYRRKVWDPPQTIVQGIAHGDRYLFSMLAAHGNLIWVHEVMGAHRAHPGGVWSGASDGRRHYNIIAARRAIACHVPRRFAVEACYDLAERAIAGCVYSLPRLKIKLLWYCVGSFLLGMLLCWRFFDGGLYSLAKIFTTQAKISYRAMKLITRSILQFVIRSLRQVLPSML